MKQIIRFLIGFVFVTILFWLGGLNWDERGVPLMFWFLLSTCVGLWVLLAPEKFPWEVEE